MSIVQWWIHKFSKFLEQAGDSYKKELYGSGYVDSTPPLYSDYSMLYDFKLTEDEFNQLSIHNRAKIIAYSTLKSIVDIRERHLDIQDRKQKSKYKKDGKN